MTIIVKKGDITKISCDAIVNPANSFGYMGGGVAGAIKRVGGVLQKDAAKAMIAVVKKFEESFENIILLHVL